MIITEKIQTLADTARRQYGNELDSTQQSFQEDELNYEILRRLSSTAVAIAGLFERTV